MFTTYEISDELNRAHIQFLERKYGGRIRAHSAATKIQRAFRHYSLRLQWRHVLNAPNSARGSRPQVSSTGTPLSPKAVDQAARSAHLRKLAQSQPSLNLRYQPSLRAQLKAERRDVVGPHGANAFDSGATNGHHSTGPSNGRMNAGNEMGKPIGENGSGQQQRTFLELMSPRLSQRRVLRTTNHQQPKVALNLDKCILDGTTATGQTGALPQTTVIYFDSDHEAGTIHVVEDDARSGAALSHLSVTDVNLGAGYHRSASPLLNSILTSSHIVNHNSTHLNSHNTTPLNGVTYASSAAAPLDSGGNAKPQHHHHSNRRHKMHQNNLNNSGTAVYYSTSSLPRTMDHRVRVMDLPVDSASGLIHLPSRVTTVMMTNHGAAASARIPQPGSSNRPAQRTDDHQSQQDLLTVGPAQPRRNSGSRLTREPTANGQPPQFHNQTVAQLQREEVTHHHHTFASVAASPTSSFSSASASIATSSGIERGGSASSSSSLQPPARTGSECAHPHSSSNASSTTTITSADASFFATTKTISSPDVGAATTTAAVCPSASPSTSSSSAAVVRCRHPQPSPKTTNAMALVMPPQMRGWSEQKRRRMYRIALNFFNKKPERGVQLLIGWGFVDDSPRSIARLFIERRGLSRQMIGEFLGTIKSPFHSAILECFVNEIPMYDMEIDKALRQLLMYFRLPGEAQKIDHIMQVFARRYRACNPNRLPAYVSPDTVYVLAFAIIMLNTDLHTPSLKDSKRMKVDEFVKNIAHIEEGQSLDRQMLTGIYERVKEFEFRTGSDHVTQVMKVDQSIIGKDKPKLVEPHRRLICYCRLHQVLDANKKQPAAAHQREVFLFNDLMIIGKVFSRKRSMGQYTLRYWSTLIGVRVETFENAHYAHGLVVAFPDGQELVFNAKNDDDRFHFVADVRESVAESTEMEQLRLELELDKQQQHQLSNGPKTAPFLYNNHRWYNNYSLNPATAGDTMIIEDGDRSASKHNESLDRRVVVVDEAAGGSTPVDGDDDGGGGASGVLDGLTAASSARVQPQQQRDSGSFNSLDSGVVEESVDYSV